MDGRRFDDIAKTLAARTSRRGALRGLLAAALGGGLGLGRLAGADAAQCGPGKNCKAGSPKAERCAGTGLVCENGQFVCPAVANATASFVGGACQYACLAGFASCDTSLANGCEVNTSTDPANCGSCGATCADGKTCQAGACLCPATAPTECSGQCVDTDTNLLHCGGCAGAGGTACSGIDVCCNGTCTDPTQFLSDPANCGTCGNACPTGHACCNGECKDTNTDALNCGGCAGAGGFACTGIDVCHQGICTTPCGTDGVCPGACYYTCTVCGCFECDPSGSPCGEYREFCCPSQNFDECLGLPSCPEETQRYVTIR